ncbi:MAG: hypothetical protein KF819_25000 [Labilithrix sp.]|nr:hypothetical protein [Labilithrix sp.]
MRPLATTDRRSFLAAAALTAAVGAAFWIPAAPAARGFFPAPLDDVYIHFDFARSLAEGHPFEWIPGNGYSSGETSPLYAFVLAVGWWLGLRGRLAGVWAAFVAIAAFASFVRSAQIVARPCPRWLSWGIALLSLSVGIVDWAIFSGMEVALFAGVLGGALLALGRARGGLDERGGLTRERAQWRLGAWTAALVLLRPEAVVLVAIFAIVAARGARRRSGVAALFRAALPGAIATALLLGMNRIATGDARAAGAQLKLLSSNPYLSEVDRARAFVENLVTFFLKGLRAELSPVSALGWVLPLLAAAALVSRARRSVSAACLAGALAWILLASWNGNAPHHNFRYYAPALLLVLAAAGSGAAALARAGRTGGIASGALLATSIVVTAGRIPGQISHFRRAAGNVRDQQIEIGARLAASTPPDARVLVGDAGAIPFVSRRDAIDALGLGGYRALPFARAAVHGEAATVELIERLPPRERPTHLALYPNWFGGITGRFGVEIDRVTIADNVICGGATKVIYRADWSGLDEQPARTDVDGDELDVGDVVSEAAHGYAPPVPHGGWTTMDVLLDASGARRFDGGRIIPAGAVESFVVARAPRGRARLVVRTSGDAGGIRAHRAGRAVDLELGALRDGAWREAFAILDGVVAGETITLEAIGREYRDYHVWIGPAR